MSDLEKPKINFIPKEPLEPPKKWDLSPETINTILNNLSGHKTFLEEKVIGILMEKYADGNISSETEKKITRLKKEGKDDRTIFEEIDGLGIVLGKEGRKGMEKRIEVLKKVSEIDIDINELINKLTLGAQGLILDELNERAGQLEKLYIETEDLEEKNQLKGKIDSLINARKELLGVITGQSPEEIEKEITKEAEAIARQQPELDQTQEGLNKLKNTALKEKFIDATLLTESRIKRAQNEILEL